jgi:hypothetical protein
VLLGLAAIHWLATYSTATILGRITRTITIFLLAGSAVLIPCIYAVIWFLQADGIAKAAAQIDGFQPSWITVIATIAAAAVAIFSSRLGRTETK